MDYLAYDRTRRRVWVPAGNTASVDVVDVTTERVTRIEGFSTAEMERHGTKRIFGPSSAAVGVGADLVDTKAIRAGQPEKITQAARAFIEAVRRARGDAKAGVRACV